MGLLSRAVRVAANNFEAPSASGLSPEWLEAVRKGLDMSTEARMARARAMGFDTETRLYHGSNADIVSFDPSKGRYGSKENATFLTSDPRIASDYAAEASENALQPSAVVYPVFVRGKYLNADDWGADNTLLLDDAAERGFDGIVARAVRDPTMFGSRAQSDIYGILNPRNIRSIHAAFDPERAGEANLLAGLAGLGVGGGLLSKMRDRSGRRHT